ncbi:MAG: hypothetical protein ABI862_21765 [Ilumatobacteraceae bacterium]
MASDAPDEQMTTDALPFSITVSNFQNPTELPDLMGFGPSVGASYAALDIQIANTRNAPVRFTALNVTVVATSGKSLSWQTRDVELVKAKEIAGGALLSAHLYVEVPAGDSPRAFVFDPHGAGATIEL